MSFENQKVESITLTSTQALDAVTFDKAASFVIQYEADVITPSAAGFVANAPLVEEVPTTDNTFTAEAHGMETGLKVEVSTTDALPSGLLTSTDYFVINLTADTFSLASSLANAQAGTAVVISDVGTGTHTITPTAIAGGVIKVQESVDGQTWYDISGVTANITTDATALLKGTSNCGQIRCHVTLTAGQLEIGYRINSK